MIIGKIPTLCQMAEKKLWRKLMWHANLQCTVLEVKQIDGLDMTVDVLVVNGYMKEGDQSVFCLRHGGGGHYISMIIGPVINYKRVNFISK